MLLWVMVVFTVAWVNFKVFQRGGRKQPKHVFVFSRSLLLNRREPQSSKTKLLLLPIMPIGIVAYGFTLSWDNLCRNSCIQVFCKLFLGYALGDGTPDTTILHWLCSWIKLERRSLKKSRLQRDSNPRPPRIPQASSFQLLKLENLLRWSFFTLIYNRSSNIWVISYILHIIETSITNRISKQVFTSYSF